MVRLPLLASSVLALAALPAWAQQSFPTSQPAIITIAREFEKPGHFGPHLQTEIRWAALNRTIPNVPSSLALVASSGAPEIWWVSTYTGLDAWGKASEYSEPSYTASLNKIAVEDGEHITGVILTQAEAVPEASYGVFPDIRTVRVYSIMTVTTRPGGEGAFVDIAKRYAAIMKAQAVTTAWRSYRVLSGAPAGTFYVFSSFPSWDAVEANRKVTDGAMAATSAADLEGFTKAISAGIVNMNVRYFTVNPRMSTVPKDMMSDPFWAGK
jgi:hypothetical protein